ncbi:MULTISPECIES: VOC family protein [Nostoc]|jgi:catechol 2,3-dioxygenase-like lactoylglutathione lyase family enzyme|uniref:VOC family protein n=1 Tax=Nostoc punctiforme FACHB-252 TaxID=1357509 RepID=A0ABR8HHL2_NOSPU|nr:MULTISPECIES: VOC family protein [Nostoc]MBC1240928.1 VOC family protein [Nostoc sp. 2RC]MBD2615318.1 VOC family protein [Nostoc punctiforme FACHB-252]MBL1200882.1 VOC family protein [Nostoc sp. GBBB01]MDZ8010746.1 VOC family protein [Nostoc sp. ZfuVER08]
MPLSETIAKEKDTRPPVAIGHVRFYVSNVPEASKFFVKIGLRLITQSEHVAVLELRGGTHLVLRTTPEPITFGTKAPFDLMVDDVFATRDALTQQGLTVSEIEPGRIHSSFTLTGPDGYILTFNSSHTGGREV